MNPPDPQIQPHRPSFSSTTCDRHPDEQFSGFCPLCLYERLSLLNPAPSQPKPTTNATSAIKSLFKSSSTNPFPPELRRSKSFSVSNREGFSGAFEPQRKSCDVRGKNSLYWHFNQADERKSTTSTEQPQAVAAEVAVENGNVGCSSTSSSGGLVDCSVYETKRKGRKESSQEDEITVCDDQLYNNMVNVVEDKVIANETVEKVKTMKDHIDLDSHNKKGPTRDFKEIAGSLLSAASGFSKKLQKWRQNQKMKKDRNGARSSNLLVEKSIGRQYRETQSEAADYGFGRRSCDTDPRFSLDAGRMSFDEPRVSWDGHMIGKTLSRMAPMLSVVEDDAPVQIPRSDSEIPVEQPPNTMNGDEAVPGGSAQTRDYYLDSSSKRRKSLDRSSSLRKTTANVMVQNEETKPVSNARVSPDDCPETFKRGFGENASIMGNGERKDPNKKSSRWSKALNIWGLIHRRSGLKYEDEDKLSSRTNGVELERSFSESWQDVRIEHNGDARGDLSRKIFRSNSSVSWRNSNGFDGSTSFRSSSVRKNNKEMNGHGKNRKDEFMFERNQSARYSPNHHVDNGLLRVYLNPLSGNWRSSSTGKSKPNHAHSIARSVLRLY